MIGPDLARNQALAGRILRIVRQVPGHADAAVEVSEGTGEIRLTIDREALASRIVLQVHDELVLEVPEGEVERIRAELPGLMSGVAKLRVPLLAEIGVGPNWDRAH